MRHKSRAPFSLTGIFLATLVFSSTLPLFAAEVDTSKLPPPAEVKIDFARDIQPILDTSCIRCHGPEKPKSRFRLDNREAALKGGEHGVDIIPGSSAGSPLIHFVAGLVPDMQMPPPGKGEPLTTNQIALLRAWIDQGAVWAAGSAGPAFSFSESPAIRWISVNGDRAQFREHYWQREGINGGLEDFELTQQIDPDTRFQASGHLLRDDYQVNLSLDENDFGFIHSGWEQYRKYYDDTGGYYPAFSPQAFSLDRDLHLDIGRAWIDFGLTLPDWPRMVLGYELQYRDGAKSTLQWSAVSQNGIARNIFPAAEGIDEHTHIIKFDLDHEIRGVRIEDNFRAEFYKLNTTQTNLVGFSAFSDNISQGYSHFEGANTFRLERQFTPWAFVSGGYFYSKLNANGSFNAQSPDIPPPAMQQVTLRRESHIVNLNGILGPWQNLTLSGGVQSEWTRQDGIGDSTFDELTFPPTSTMMLADLDESFVDENAALRYSGVPFTALFAEVRARQSRIGQYEDENSPAPESDNEFLRNTDFTGRSYDARTGFNTSPWSWVTLSAHYRRSDDDSRYDNNLKLSLSPFGLPFGYSAFINHRDLATDEWETKAAFHLLRWLKLSLSYRMETTDFHTDTGSVPSSALPPGVTIPGGEILAGRYHAHVYGLSTVLTPWQRLYLSTTFSYQDTTMTTAGEAATAFAPGFVPSVVPYRGDIYTSLVSGTYIFNQATDLLLSYSFSYADFSQHNYGDATGGGLPLGMRYHQHALQTGLAHRITKNLTTRLQYVYFYYDEPSSGTFKNYNGNGVLATVTCQFR